MSNYKSNNYNKSSTTKSPVTISYENWDPTNIRLGPKKTNAYGGHSVAVFSNQTNSWPCIKSPPMTTWGLSEWKDDSGKANPKYSISHQFPTEAYPSPECNMFLAQLKAFEEKVIDLMTANSYMYWGKEKIRAVVLDGFTSSIKYSKKAPEKAPTWNTKVRIYMDPNVGYDVWKLEVYNAKKQLVFPNPNNPDVCVMDLIPKLSACRTLAQCSIYIGATAGWGITWTIVQTMVMSEKQNHAITGCQFDDDDDDEDVEITDNVEAVVDAVVPVVVVDTAVAQPVYTGVTVNAAVAASTYVEDDDQSNSDPESESESTSSTIEEAAIEQVKPVAVAKKIVKTVTKPVTVPSAPIDVVTEPVVVTKKLVKKK